MVHSKSSYFFEPLSMLDYSMLVMEDPIHPMHVAALTLFKPSRLTRADGGVNFKALVRSFAAALPHVPRYRQKLMWQDPQQIHANLRTPGWLERMREQPPVWVDDADFDIQYHLRHAALPRPGTEAQLKTLVGRLVAAPLDRSRPLWESWVIEGMHSRQLAILIKVHHCMVDGMSGVGLAQQLLSPDPHQRRARAAEFKPRPAPTLADLRREDLDHKLKLTLGAAEGLGELLLKPSRLLQSTGKTFRSFQEVLSSNAGITQSDTPLNGELSLHRNVEWMETSLKDIKAIKNAWHCSINDVLLVIVTGAMRQYLGHRGVDIDNTPFRVGMPISIRSAGDDSTGNQISFKLLELPIAHGDTQTQLQLIREQTLHVDKGSQSLVVKSLMALVEYVPGIMPMLARGFAGPGNCYLTNIPGPGFPLYQLGAELDSIIPVAPLNGNMGLCIGAMSYNGKICWGLIGDPDLIPDIDVLVKMIADCRAAIRKAVKAEAASTRASAKRGKATGKKQPASVAGKAGSPTA